MEPTYGASVGGKRQVILDKRNVETSSLLEVSVGEKFGEETAVIGVANRTENKYFR